MSASRPVAVPARDAHAQVAWAIRRLCVEPGLPIHRLAGELGVTATAFSRTFRRMTAVTPVLFAQSLRLIDAREALSVSASVLDAALAAGLSGGGRLHDLLVRHEVMTPGQYRHGGAGMEIEFATHATPLGPVVTAITPLGLAHLGFVSSGESPARELRRRWPRATLCEVPNSGAAAIAAAFLGKPMVLPLHLQGSAFQLKVWQALLSLSPDVHVSYAALAAALGRPGAARAVGGAVARNPIAVLVPCHRVLAASGALGGYRWGVGRKRALLALEAARHASMTA